MSHGKPAELRAQVLHVSGVGRGAVEPKSIKKGGKTKKMVFGNKGKQRLRSGVDLHPWPQVERFVKQSSDLMS